MKIIDLRSDTVTHPTPEMRQAMLTAEVGDDVYGEDPTVNRLEAIAAARMGKPAALFTTSGTQSNLAAVLAHTRHGNEILLGSHSHIFSYEVGGAAALGGVVMTTLPNDTSGRISLLDIRRAIRPRNVHSPETTLLCLENTHNRCGGAVLTPEYTAEICELAHSYGLKIHLDGARIFNAAIALGVPAESLARQVDSVSFCVSKGLSAPAGSLLCGDRDFIEQARRVRQMLGGGMRQAGILAAAGIVALEKMVDRLAEDHATARHLAAGLATIPSLILNGGQPATNIVMFEIAAGLSAEQFRLELDKAGVKIGSRGGNLFRAVTHRMISTADIGAALQIIEKVTRQLR